jgi:hypothetical protein
MWANNTLIAMTVLSFITTILPDQLNLKGITDAAYILHERYKELFIALESETITYKEAVKRYRCIFLSEIPTWWKKLDPAGPHEFDIYSDYREDYQCEKEYNLKNDLDLAKKSDDFLIALLKL